MFLVEDLFRSFNVANFLGTLLPGHRQQPIDIIAADCGFRGHRRHQFQALQFRGGLFVDILGHTGGVDLLLQLVGFVFLAAAQFLLNRLELFVEVILFLRAFHLALYARIDVAVDIQLFQFNFQNVADAVQALQRIGGFEQVLLLVDRQVAGLQQSCRKGAKGRRREQQRSWCRNSGSAKA